MLRGCLDSESLTNNWGSTHALESQLEIIFKIAKHFQEILLLDEADAFMAKRTTLHDSHNRLVTIFLRKLEYYQGVLFLTSNRGIDFDDAILSRIHMVIEFKGLTEDSRKDLWTTFLSKACTIQGPSTVKEDELLLLASKNHNCREMGPSKSSAGFLLTFVNQIKNIAAIAHAIAEVDKSRVSYEHIKLAAESSEKISTEFGNRSSVVGIYM